MTTEISKTSKSSGYLHLYTGCMYSRKTTQMLQYVCNYALLSDTDVCIINHAFDVRDDKISTHNPLAPSVKALPKNVHCFQSEKLDSVHIDNYKVIGIDEAQFFPDLYETVCKWLSQGKRIIVAGLNGDAQMKPFGQMHLLISKADMIEFCTAICTICIKEHSGGPPSPDLLNTMKASFSKKISGDVSQTIDVGAADKYIPVCRKHYCEDETQNE
jgi:thymidine kinase